MLGFLLGLIGLISLPLIGLIVGIVGTLSYVKDMEVDEFYKTFVQKKAWHDRGRLADRIKDEL